ncbi:MAG: hypothetical protein QOJ45_1162 [Verrucomicrobiota bacterium]|jgi:hypothetical protein
MEMRPVIAPEHDLQLFCYRMIDRDPVAILEAASAEIAYCRHNHREQTKQLDFRKGSKGQQYCDDLQMLVRVLMNGQFPTDIDAKFMAAIAPLIKILLRKWRIGRLHEYFKE